MRSSAKLLASLWGCPNPDLIAPESCPVRGFVMTANRSLFISYSRKDIRIVAPIVQLLRIGGGNIFRDEDSIAPGKRWKAELEKAIDAADTVILFWSKSSSQSEQVRAEYERAMEHKKDVVPVLMDDEPLVASLQQYQHLDFRKAIHTAMASAVDSVRRALLLAEFASREDLEDSFEEHPHLQLRFEDSAVERMKIALYPRIGEPVESAEQIINQIRARGYAVSVHEIQHPLWHYPAVRRFVPETCVEMRAVKLDAPADRPKIARDLYGNDETAVLVCAKRLAEMITPAE